MMLSEKENNRQKKVTRAMSMNRKSRVVCLHAAMFGLERGLVSISLVRIVKKKYIGTEAGKRVHVHVVVQARS